MSLITFRYVTNPAKIGRKYSFKTLEGAQARAHKLVGQRPKVDPDGYVSHRRTGNCLFFFGCTLTELFPQLQDSPKSQTQGWIEVIREQGREMRDRSR